MLAFDAQYDPDYVSEKKTAENLLENRKNVGKARNSRAAKHISVVCY